jgi:hypothetical protein
LRIDFAKYRRLPETGVPVANAAFIIPRHGFADSQRISQMQDIIPIKGRPIGLGRYFLRENRQDRQNRLR